jgi:hypothetical protein
MKLLIYSIIKLFNLLLLINKFMITISIIVADLNKKF